MKTRFTVLEFFAGGGMVRLGLGDSWRCLLANDLDPMKCEAYRANFGGGELIESDIGALSINDLPSTRADLAWGSFPCQDLSLAGARAGIAGGRSSAFFPFWSLMEAMAAEGRAPLMIALENVTGLISSNGGRDFACVIERLTGAGYRTTACVLDAQRFTPQSRPRLFILGFSKELTPPAVLSPLMDETTPESLIRAQAAMSAKAKTSWFWLGERPQAQRNSRLSNIIDWTAPVWDAPSKTQALIDMMSRPQRARLEKIAANRARRAGAAFRRTRIENGENVQRVEARFDGLAGCLRTPAGGSSRQIIFAIENGVVRSRLMNPREAAQLMGLPDDYALPENANAALKLAGDGVCVPVVRWLADAVFEPALKGARTRKAA
ncbi:MAG: DNA cytosine methyltransferase [Hyphococcus sp.]